jgi:uncharacterized protein
VPVNRHDVSFAGLDGTRLSGTITLPGGADPGPGVVLVGGSGPADRHSRGFFDAIRDQLAAAGVAVLAYDKRGAGQSAGDWPTATVDDLAGDAAAAVAVLAASERVEPDSVGVLGHSEGGWVALRLAARSPEPPAWLILSSCPAVSFVAAERYAMTAAGVDPGLAETVFARLLAAVRAGGDHEQGQRVLEAGADERLRAMLRADGFRLEADTWAVLCAWGHYDPAADLAALRARTLAVFGAADPLVPVPDSVDRLERSAAATGRVQRIVVVPGTGHRFETETGPDPAYLGALSAWCRGSRPED